MNSPWSFITHGSLISSRILVTVEDYFGKRDNVDTTLLFCFLASSHFVRILLLPKLITSIRRREMISVFLMRLPNLSIKLRKNYSGYLASTSSWEVSTIETLQFTVLTGEYLDLFTITVLLFSNKECGTRLHQ